MVSFYLILLTNTLAIEFREQNSSNRVIKVMLSVVLMHDFNVLALSRISPCFSKQAAVSIALKMESDGTFLLMVETSSKTLDSMPEARIRKVF